MRPSSGTGVETMGAGLETGLLEKTAGAAIRLGRDRDGATAIEYALIAGGISVAIAVIVGNIGTRVAAFFAAIPGWF